MYNEIMNKVAIFGKKGSIAKFDLSDSFSVALNGNIASWDDDAMLTGTRAALAGSDGYMSL